MPSSDLHDGNPRSSPAFKHGCDDKFLLSQHPPQYCSPNYSDRHFARDFSQSNNPIANPQSYTRNLSHTFPSHRQCNVEETFQDLKEKNESQANVIMEMKIKVAVLEHEVKRAGEDKDYITNCVGTVIGALTRSHNTSSTINVDSCRQTPPPSHMVIHKEDGHTITNTYRGGKETDSLPAHTVIHKENGHTITKSYRGGKEVPNHYRLVIDLEQEIERLQCLNKSLRWDLLEAKRNKNAEDERKHCETVKDLEHEIKMLRMNNKLLNCQVRERQLSGTDCKCRATNQEDFPHTYERSRDHRRSISMSDRRIEDGDLNGKGRHADLDDEDGDEDSRDEYSTATRDFPSEDVKCLSGTQSLKSQVDNSRLIDSFASDSTTISNMSVLAAQQKTFVDVGMDSLDDILGLDFPATTTGSSDPTSLLISVPEEGEINIDEAVQMHQKTINRFVDMPKPGVLKTGFEINGSYRGENYDTPRPSPRASNGMGMENGRTGQHVTRNYNLNGPPASFNQLLPLPNSASLSFDSKSNDRTPLWSSQEERDNAIIHNKQISGLHTPKYFADFFRYGIAFNPIETNSNYMRTVNISNLPKDVGLRDMLAKVRGGGVVSAILCNTMNMMGCMTATVQFLHEKAAEEYVDYVLAHPVAFPASSSDDDDRGEMKNAIVALVNTPTWPFSITAYRRIYKHRQTRCLVISSFPSHLSLKMLVYDLACHNGHRAASLLNIDISDDNTLFLEFSSINAAGSAFGILTGRGLYDRCIVSFAEDPCRRPLEDLLTPLELKPKNPVMALPPSRDGDLRISCDNCEEEFNSHNRLFTHLRFEHGIGRDRCFDDDYASSCSDSEDKRARDIIDEVSTLQGKSLAALSNQKVEIPCFSGVGIGSSSWADEVNEEVGPLDDVALAVVPAIGAPSYSPTSSQVVSSEQTDVEAKTTAIMVDSVNELMVQGGNKTWKDRKMPMGLAGSKYATLIPGFEDQPYSTHSSRARSSSSADVLQQHTEFSSAPTSQSFFGTQNKDVDHSATTDGSLSKKQSERHGAAKSPGLVQVLSFEKSSDNDEMAFSSLHDMDNLSTSPPSVDLEKLLATPTFSDVSDTPGLASQIFLVTHKLDRKSEDGFNATINPDEISLDVDDNDDDSEIHGVKEGKNREVGADTALEKVLNQEIKP